MVQHPLRFERYGDGLLLSQPLHTQPAWPPQPVHTLDAAALAATTVPAAHRTHFGTPPATIVAQGMWQSYTKNVNPAIVHQQVATGV